MKIARRRAKSGDFDYACQLHHRTMRAYVEPVYGWDDDHQSDHFRQTFAPDSAWVIIADGQEAGWLQIYEREGHIHLGQLFVAPEFQNRGIGKTTVEQLKSEARQRGLAILLGVLETNPAVRFYERLGFRVVGDEQHRVLMRWDGDEGDFG